MASISQEFDSAPMGKRVLYPTVATFCVLSVGLLFNIALASLGMANKAPMDRVIVALAPLAGFAITLPIYFLERSKVARFRIDENCLVLGRKRFPLEGATSIERDPKVMCWAAKLVANGGLGSLRGSFRSKRLGKFYAFMTGTENAVVIKWPDRTVAVSPLDTEFFILSAKSAAGLH
jgi:hypothetical protein